MNNEFKCQANENDTILVEKSDKHPGCIYLEMNTGGLVINEQSVVLDRGQCIDLVDQIDELCGIGYEDRQNKLRLRVLEWARARDLLKPENSLRQYAKLNSEVGELADAILENDRAKIEDAIGDIQVVLTILTKQLGFSGMDDCLEGALNIIEKRTGKTINGTFIKDN